MSRSGNVWHNAAMEGFFSSLKTERTARKVYWTRDDAKGDVLDYVERFYKPRRRHSSPLLLSEIAMYKCGAAMTLGTGTGKQGNTHRYYVCSGPRGEDFMTRLSTNRL
jgi:hypothetical protein